MNGFKNTIAIIGCSFLTEKMPEEIQVFGFRKIILQETKVSFSKFILGVKV